MFFSYQRIAPCQFISYGIGVFDQGFGISRDKFIKTIGESESIWEKNAGRELFNYKSASKFKINLVFDERQARTVEAGQTKTQISASQENYDSLVAQYKLKSIDYERTLNSYNIAVASFDSALNNYNQQVAKVNSKGGATPKEYQELENIRKQLESQKASLDIQRAALNRTADDLNYMRDQINELASKLNIQVDIFNERFGEAREFDQGEYRGNEINIYQFDSVSDLRLVLAHELGHALGLGHVDNSESIMYFLMGEQDPVNPSLTPQDQVAFDKVCNASTTEKIKYLIDTLISRTSHRN